MKAVVLLSGGIDSTTCLAQAVEDYGRDSVLALSLSYGQKHSKELEAAKAVSQYYEVSHQIQDLSEVFKLSDCTLLNHSSHEMEHTSYADQLKETNGKPVNTYVPFRNGLFLAYAAAIAVSVHAEHILYGAHQDDAAGNAYPDCSEIFEHHMGQAIYEGSGKSVKLNSPLIGLNKAGVVQLGLHLKAPYHLTWSCYEGGDKPCGTCGTCRDRQLAFESNNIVDPAVHL